MKDRFAYLSNRAKFAIVFGLIIIAVLGGRYALKREELSLFVYGIYDDCMTIHTRDKGETVLLFCKGDKPEYRSEQIRFRNNQSVLHARLESYLKTADLFSRRLAGSGAQEKDLLLLRQVAAEGEQLKRELQITIDWLSVDSSSRMLQLSKVREDLGVLAADKSGTQDAERHVSLTKHIEALDRFVELLGGELRTEQSRLTLVSDFLAILRSHDARGVKKD